VGGGFEWWALEASCGRRIRVVGAGGKLWEPKPNGGHRSQMVEWWRSGAEAIGGGRWHMVDTVIVLLAWSSCCSRGRLFVAAIVILLP